MKTFILSCLVLLLSTACKKDRTCECRNVNNTYEAGQVKASKSAAKKHCQSLSAGSTECYLK